MEKDGLLYAYVLSPTGTGQRICLSEVPKWEPTQGFLWMHFDYSHPNAQQWLKQESGVDALNCFRLLSEESRPRASISKNGILLSLRGVNLNPGQDVEDMVSIRIWLEKDRIITTQRRNLLSVRDLKNAIEQGLGPQSPIDFLQKLSNRLLNRIGDVIDNIDDQVDLLEEQVLTVESRLLRTKIADIRRQAISLRRYLAPQREAYYRLYAEPNNFIDDMNRSCIRESSDRIVHYIEDLDESRERAAITYEELTNRLSEQLDKRMYLLSVAAVIFLPLSFITGLLGINVAGIPLAQNHFGFIIVCLILSAITFGLIYLLRKYQWI